MSTLKVNAISNVAGTGSPNITEQAKAWVNFNGTGTVAIRADYNVSSITDNATGQYTVNFTNAVPNSNYAAVGMVEGGVFMAENNLTPVRTTSAYKILTYNTDAIALDRQFISVTIFD